MNARELGSIVAKSLAIYALLRSLSLVAYWTQGLSYIRISKELGSFFASHYGVDLFLSGVYLLIAAVLWVNAHRFGIVKGEIEDAQPMKRISWDRLAFAVLGLFIALSNLNFAAYWFESVISSDPADRIRWTQSLPVLITFLIGGCMWLYYGPGTSFLRRAARWPSYPDD